MILRPPSTTTPENIYHLKRFIMKAKSSHGCNFLFLSCCKKIISWVCCYYRIAKLYYYDNDTFLIIKKNFAGFSKQKQNKQPTSKLTSIVMIPKMFVIIMMTTLRKVKFMCLLNMPHLRISSFEWACPFGIWEYIHITNTTSNIMSRSVHC